MLRKSLFGALVAAVFGTTAAQAVTTTATISGPTTTTVGSTENFTIDYAFTGLPAYKYAQGSATYSVDGTALGTVSLNSAAGSFGFSYTFDQVKDYTFDLAGTLNFYDDVYQYLYTYTYGYSCGSRWNRRTCYSSSPVYGYRTQVVETGTLSGSLGVSAVSPVPLPASAVLLLGALGGLGLIRRRTVAA